jgi:putative transposase
MKQKQFTEEQIIGILKEGDEADNIRAICRQHYITEQTYYRWRNKYGGMAVSSVRRLRALERENAELKKVVTAQALDLRMLRDVAAKKW